MRLLRVLLLLSWLPVTPARAAETFQTPPRPTGVRLRCPLLLSQFRAAASAWRNATNQGLLRQIAADPSNSFFRQALGERLETDFADDLSGKDEERTRIRGRFLSQSVALERLLEKYGVDSVAQLPAHAREEGRGIHQELTELFAKHGARWTPRIAPAKGFQFKNGVVSGVTVDLRDFFDRTDGLNAIDALDAFSRKLPTTVHTWEIVGGTPEHLEAFLRWDKKARFPTLTLGSALGPVEGVIAALAPHAAKLQNVAFEGYDFDGAQLASLEQLGNSVSPRGVPILTHARLQQADDLLLGFAHVPERVRQIAWHSLLRKATSSFRIEDFHDAMSPQILRDLQFAIHDPEFWRLLQTHGPEDLLPIYEQFPMKPVELRATFLRKMLLHLSTDSVATFVQNTLRNESRSRRMVSPAGAMLNDIFASDLLAEPRFTAVRAMRTLQQQQRDKEGFALAQQRYLADEKADVSDKAAYVAQQIGDPAVRKILEEAPQNEHWKAVQAEVGKSTLYFAWKEIVKDPNYQSGLPILRGQLEADKKRWTFSPTGAGSERSNGTFPITSFDALDLTVRLNAWAETSGHPYRYEMDPQTVGPRLEHALVRRPVAR